MITTPLKLQFDYTPGQPSRPGVARLPKVYQGAPYDVALRVKVGETYRDFRSYDEIRMHVRTAPLAPLLFALSKSAGELYGTVDTFGIQFNAAKTEALALSPAPGVVAECRFVFDIELMIGGEVVERFAEGSGIIALNSTR